MARNKHLRKAKLVKNDEFYTRYEDIENELQHYKKHFKGKVVYCNCDDYRMSNFSKYFENNFEVLGLKKLIVSGLGVGSYLVLERGKTTDDVQRKILYYADEEPIKMTQLEFFDLCDKGYSELSLED